MSNKQILGVLAVLLVLAFIVGTWVSSTKPAVTEPTAGDTSPILKGTAESDLNYHYAEQAPGFRIEAVYPIRVPLPTPEASAKAALTIEQKLAEAIAAFKADAAQMLSAEELQRLEESGRYYALGFEYKDYVAEGHHSYAYQVYQDTGGAHPNAFYLTYVFDLDGNLITLESLFKPGARYLDRLSAVVQPKVAAELRTRFNAELSPDMLETVRMGTAPTPETLQFFVLHDGNLILFFPPYQVASYAAGSFEIPVSFTELSDILKPEVMQ